MNKHTPPQTMTTGFGSNRALNDGRRFFLFNVSSNIVNIVITSLVMLAFVPYLIRKLGPEGYGIISLGNLVALYALCLCNGLSTAFVRNLAINLGSGDYGSARRTFSSGIMLSAHTIFICIGPVVLLAWQFPVLFQIPSQLVRGSQIFVAAVLLQVLITVIEDNFSSSAVVLHRFDLRNVVRLITLGVRVSSVVICFMFFEAQIWHVGLAVLLSALVSLLGSVLLCGYLTPTLMFRPSYVDIGRTYELAGTGCSMAFNRIGLVILISSDLILINWFFDPVTTGYFGVLYLLAELMRNGVDAVSSVLSPGVLVQYARRDFMKLASMMRQSIKFLSLALAIAVGILCAFGGTLLKLWLGPEFRSLDLALVIVCGHFSMTLGAVPLQHVLTAYDKVRVLSVWTLLLSVVNFTLAAAVAKWSGLGPIGVVSITGLILTVRTVLLARLAARSLEISPAVFLAPLFQGFVVTIGVGVLTLLFVQVHNPKGWLDLAICASAVGIFSLGFVFNFFLDRSDRIVLFRLLPSRFRRSLRNYGFAGRKRCIREAPDDAH